MTNHIDFSQKVFYNSEELAKRLDVTPGWVKYNRNTSKHPIPHKKFGLYVRYDKDDILDWFGRKDLEIEFYSTKTLASILNLPINWLNHNRSSKNPIPFRKIGSIVRYNKTEVNSWLNKNKQ